MSIARLRHAAVRACLVGLAALAVACSSPTSQEAATPAAPVSAAGQEAPRQLGLCASCHGRHGISVAANAPDLAGRDRDELLAAMQAYLDGSRPYPPMRAMLGPIPLADRKRLAQWYADQAKPTGDEE